jgi:ElaB/YqjD/DUF883 family membrane-anchored ribosome-binding protein
MTASTNADATLVSLQDDIAALKRDVTSLMTHLRRDATEGVQTAAAQIDDSMHRAYTSLSSSGEQSIKNVSRQIEAHPLIAVLLALGLGHLSGRLLSR